MLKSDLLMISSGVTQEYLAPRHIVSHRGPGQTDPGMYAGLERFPGGESTDARFHQWDINLTLSGRCLFHHESGCFEAEQADLIFVRPGAWMAWQVPPDEPEWCVVYAVCHLPLHCEEWLNAYEFVSGMARVHIEDAPLLARVRTGMKAVHRIYKRGVLNRDEWAMLALERVLLTLHTHLIRQCKPLDARVQEAVQFIHEHFAEPLTVGDIAHSAYLSVSQLSFLFTRQMGIAPVQYLERLRLTRAAEMLRFTSNSIAEIAVATGYKDASYFGARFHRHSGLSPSAYRRSQSLRM